MFEGFTEEASDFLWGIRFNNDREWFLNHKQTYLTQVQTPLKELAGEVFAEFGARHGDLGLELHVSRIYRDARRLHAKGPYKDHLWFSFRPVGSGGEHWTYRPVFWFEIRPEGYGYGVGIYTARPAIMAYFRKELDRDPQELLRLDALLNTRPEFVLDSPEYRRPKKVVPPPLDRWYNRKGMGITCDRSWDDTLGSRELVATLNDAYEFLLPFYRYFLDICVKGETVIE